MKDDPQDKLIRYLESLDISNVEGAVSGKGCKVYRDSPLSTLIFECFKWRVGASELVRNDRLCVRKLVDESHSSSWKDKIQPNSIIRMSGHFAEVGTSGDFSDYAQFLLHEIQVADVHASPLSAVGDKLARSCDRFGDFVSDVDTGDLTGKSAWSDSEIELSVDPLEFDEQIAVLAELFENQEMWGKRFNDAILSKMLDLKNSAWLDDNEEPLSPSKFLARLSASSISIRNVGRKQFDFFYFCDELFGDHAIQITASVGDGIESIGLIG